MDEILKQEEICYINILGINIADLTIDLLLKKIENYLESKNNHIIFTPNVDDIIKAHNDLEFKNALLNSSLNIPDGMGIVFGARMLGENFKEMIGGRRLLPIICNYAQKKKWNIFLMGSKDGIAIKAAEKIILNFGEVSIVGALSPSMNIIDDENETENIINKINNSKTNILFVGLGSPKGKIWIMRNKNKFSSMVIIEVGGTFDVISGIRKIPPLWMTDCGLEWFYRLIENPKYYWKRYLVDDPVFYFWVINEKFKRIMRLN
jgi:N-acetylglucosaminyldiphosphoundecaprenol N-acetyl-beta-D-mannosaminyltransferase